MNFSRIVTLDFETERIEPRPIYPPEPVGLAVRAQGFGSRYLAWGHPTENNCTRADGLQLLSNIWHDQSAELLFHNAPFDVSVGIERLGLPPLPWHRAHDTKILLFLEDPHAKDLSLKPSCERLLDWPAEEQDELYAWIWEHRKALVAQYGGKITKAKSGEGAMGGWIAKAPGDLVGRYAIGDVDRTFELFKFLHPLVLSRGMGVSYDRERRLMPILLENERTGLRTDMVELARDVPIYQQALEDVETRMRHYLNVPQDFSFDKDRDVADAFQAAGVVQEDAWVETPGGQLSVSKVNLPPESFADPLFASAFGYRNRLVTCLKMFMLPWLEQASANNGFIHTSWNQVRSEKGGARTGRPSMTKPNLLNVSKSWDDRGDGYIHPTLLNLPELPLVRKYILPDPGHLFVHRDFDGQELRIFAHFESGDLMRQYLENAELDPHGWVKGRILEMVGRDLDRTSTKIMNFQSIYGGGLNAISQKLKCSMAEAKQFKAFHDQALPGRKILDEEIKRIVRRNEPIRTWGGRLYYCEEPKKIKGRLQTFEYKLINYLVQGSAADVTKEAICRWHEQDGTGDGSRFLLTVYDEINLSSPRAVVGEAMAFLKEIMDGMELDVPMRSSGKVGESWGTAKKVA
jgi:DNA polymerase I-like protein with 3'-5' exonuclease and polymerase domains